MPTSSMLRAKGLHTFENYLSNVPEGSLFKAQNVNIDRDGIIEPRRGIKVTADLPSIAKQLLQYKNRILAHYDDSIAYLSDSDPATITTFQGRSDITMTTGSDLLTLTFHGFTIGDIIKFTSITPASGIFLIGVDYYVVNIANENQFKIATTPSDPPIVSDNNYDATIQYDYVFEEVSQDLRIKSIEMNSSLYVTTKDGIKKIASLDPFLVSDAGGVNALDVALSLDITGGANGFFGPLSAAPTDKDVEVAYSVVWGTKDVNNVLILGKPSSRAVITNTTGQYYNVNVEFAVPARINEDYFFQIYRTQTALIGGSGAEFKLVYEAPFKITATEATDGYDYDPVTNSVMVTDRQPEDLRDSGTPLYTNEFSGEGVLQANDRPPVAKDIAIYKNCAFYANTRTSFKQELTFIGFDGVEVFNIVGPIVVGGGNATLTVDAPHGLNSGDYFALAGTDADGEQIAGTGTTGTTIVFPTSALSINQVDGGGTINKSHLIVSNFDGTVKRRYYLVGRAEQWELTAPAKASTNDGAYFHLTTSDDKIPFTFWMNVTGTAVAPSFPNRVLIEIDISDAGITTDAEVAEVITQVLNDTFEFTVDTTGAVMTISTYNSGKVTDPLSGTVSVAPAFGGTFNPVAHIDGFGEDASLRFVRISSNPSPASRIDDTTRSLVTVINRDEISAVEGYYLSTGSNDLPGAFLLESKEISLTPFKVQANNQSFGRMFNPEITNEVTATNSEEGNALYFSKVQQPEAVPIVNKINIGPRDKVILRIIGLRDSLFILKEEGIYRLSGENPTNFQVALFDNSASLIAADTAAVLNNQIYCLTTQGVSTVSETGVGVISRPIENLINKVTSPLYPNYSTVSFGVSYEADRSYFLFVGDNPSDSAATSCFRFNTFTQCWTAWIKDAQCGLVETSKNKLYIGPPDIPAVEVERKTLTSRDYADRQFDRQISTVQFGNIYIDSATNVSPGDVLTQTQYLSVPQYNRLIKKLKIDPLVSTNSAIIGLTTIESNNTSLVTKMNELVDALNIADPSTVYVYNGSSDFVSIQTQYNVIINQLNISSGLFYANYELSVGTIYFDLLITSVNKAQNTVRVLNSPPYIIGPAVHYKAIHSDVVWSPISLGDPSVSKHVREGTFLLESTSLVGATVGYATDLSGNFETIPHLLDGDGGWGDSIYQNVAWGGEGIAYPIRTLIPAQKQRCRYIKAEFLHQNAFFKFSILGISYTFEMMSERAWK